jgi:hypothetical protein
VLEHQALSLVVERSGPRFGWAFIRGAVGAKVVLTARQTLYLNPENENHA